MIQLAALKALPWRLIGAGVAVAALIGAVGWFSHARYTAGESAGRAQVQKQWDEARTAQERAYSAQKAATEAQIAADKKAAEELQRELETRLAAADASGRDLARRLQDYRVRASRCAVSTPTGTAPGPDDPAGESPGDEAIGRATEEVFSACKRDAERLAGFQEWVRATR